VDLVRIDLQLHAQDSGLPRRRPALARFSPA